VADGAIDFVIGKLNALVGDAPRLNGVSVMTAAGEKMLPAERLLAFFGLTMKLGPIAEFGLEFLRESDPRRHQETLRPSAPGIFAIGGHQRLSGQAQADLVRIPRGSP